MSSGVKAFALAVASAFILVTGIPNAKAALGAELLPNTGFEAGVNPAPPQQGADQPLVPVGWMFEGAAGLFDHTPHQHHGGRYGAAISAPVSGPRKLCQGNPKPDTLPDVIPRTCPPLDATATAKDTVGGRAASITPAWRPQNAVAVQAGKQYQVAGWVMWEVATAEYGGAWVRVRWLDANGVGISQTSAFSKFATTASSTYLGWTPFSAVVSAPAGAVKAVPLFGTHDDTFITKVVYDDVSFRAIV